jgi:hypothetical protein
VFPYFHISPSVFNSIFFPEPVPVPVFAKNIETEMGDEFFRPFPSVFMQSWNPRDMGIGDPSEFRAALLWRDLHNTMVSDL